jgi:hypothetical protein
MACCGVKVLARSVAELRRCLDEDVVLALDRIWVPFMPLLYRKSWLKAAMVAPTRISEYALADLSVT